jgi:hypothetical protein
MKQFKRLLESSETFRRIFKEESSRIKRILREYNEAEIWKKLPDSVRKQALRSVDPELGSDYADEYVNVEWLKLPDVVTNRIDISKYDMPDSINPVALADYIQQNSNKLPTQPWYQASVGPKLRTDQVVKLLNSGLTSTTYLTKDIIGQMIAAAPDLEDINYDELIDKSGIGSFTPFTGNIGGPSKNKDWRGGNWTGD